MARMLSRQGNQEHGVSLTSEILRLSVCADSRTVWPDDFAGRLPGLPGSPERVACLAGRMCMGIGGFEEPTPQEAEELRRIIATNEANLRLGRPDSDD